MNTETPAWLTAPIAILIAAVMVSASIIYVGSGSTASLLGAGSDVPSVSNKPVVVKDPATLFGPTDPSQGNPDAKVTIVEFSDFQCPYCRAFFEGAYTQIKQQYIDTGKVRLVFRDYPLSFHPAAKPAALAAGCAQDQGKFWEYHDRMFIEQGKQGTGTITFGATELKSWASQLGMNMTTFNNCLDSSKYAAAVEADTKAGAAAGVSGTPSFFINGELLVGAQPFATFKAAIDKALAK